MSENIIIEPGTKIRQDGKSYRVTDTAVVSGQLEEVKQQTNRHRAIWCPDPECRETQIKVKRERGSKRASYDILRGCDLSTMPQCGTCGKVMEWRTSGEESGE